MIPLILESKKTRHKLGNTDRKLVAAKGGGIGGKGTLRGKEKRHQRPVTDKSQARKGLQRE